LSRFWRLLATALLAAAILLALAPASALAAHVGCGDTITTDTKLDSDLIDCPGNGIVIGADNITLDLNGHTIDGTSSSGDGVANVAHLGATIKGGTIQGFGVGVRLGTCSPATGVHWETSFLVPTGTRYGASRFRGTGWPSSWGRQFTT
jgi:hypothetical protein